MCPVDPSEPSRNDVSFFSDEEELPLPSAAQTASELAAVFGGLLRADFGGARRGAVLGAIEAAGSGERPRLLQGLCDAYMDEDLIRFIEASAERRRRAAELALRVAPPDPSPAHNDATYAALAAFDEWAAYTYPLIIVPGYTPEDIKAPAPGVHPIAQRRLEQAVLDVKAKLAPFILVSGSNVRPRGTPYYEAIEMKRALVAMGVPADRVLVEARARHSTTNLRNAGRVLFERRLARAVITTSGGGVAGSNVFDQDFYFGNPVLSTFYSRCERELGYRVGELKRVGPSHTELIPSPDVRRINYRDPLDP